MVYPLSFSEILNIKGLTSYIKLVEAKPAVLRIVDEMLQYGSFVDVFNSKEEFKRDIISSYYDTIILKDCAENNMIRDIVKFKELSYYLISNITSLYSYNSLSKSVKIHDKSSKEYVQHLQNAYLCSELKQFSYSVKEQQNNRKKLYLVDNGFISLSFRFSSSKGILLENLVFTELHKSNKKFFYNKGFECDFIIQNEDNSFEAIQVCYELNDHNSKREINSLKKDRKNIKNKSKYYNYL
ncbi:MAG: ATPase [Candidatus Magnetoglobus multicellularis str. Araruama]|uniref:ATPase n=1 Tax=Candidatus Magnetoglobus multicellularis str. Araruama TaxID=890399 RepID=A0A1V1NUN2_9BACT|nr:MAG: ATPase [Candidatus Magnetoglobus multicellularis str. Araruama]